MEGVLVAVLEQVEHACHHVGGACGVQFQVRIGVDVVVAAETFARRTMFPQGLESEIFRQTDYVVPPPVGRIPLQQRRVGAAIVEDVYVRKAALLERSDQAAQRGQSVETVDYDGYVARVLDLRGADPLQRVEPRARIKSFVSPKSSIIGRFVW